MAEFLVEAYVSRAELSVPSNNVVSSAAAELTREGRDVRLLGSILVREDETCFYVFEAQSGEHVMEAATRSGLQIERVVDAVLEMGVA